MSAARLDLIWDTQTEPGAFSIRITPAPAAKSVRQLGSLPGAVRCPECHSIVYSRRHRLCGVCSNPLPDALLFNPWEAKRVEALLSSERQRHRKWLEQRNALED
jgi:ribosomal protein L32